MTDQRNVDARATLWGRARTAIDILGLDSSHLMMSVQGFGLLSPAFKGELLELARAAWRSHWGTQPNGRGNRTPEVTIDRVNGGWQWRLWSCDDDGTEWGGVGTCAIGVVVTTESEAIVCALEAVPHSNALAEPESSSTSDAGR